MSSKKWNEAIAHFDSAISAANRNGFVQDNALAHERLGLCHGAMGKELVAKAYLEEAMRLYRVWGAEGKCQHLLQTCPYFKRETSTDRRHLTGTHSLKPEAIDLETVLKGTQTLSAQIKEDQLIASIMEIALENAGAQMGALLLVKNELMSLVALAREGRIETMPQDTLPYGTLLANTPLHFVMRTREPLVLNDASNDTRFNQDPYIKTHQIRTLICIPLLHKGQLLGLLYMENNVLSQNFTTQRLGILEWLGTQAAIALENARLYGDLSRYSQDLEQKVAERTLVIQEKNQQILASIRYAKRIQNAVLPQPDLLNEICAEHFLLFRPRDLVSGDFFWLKNGKSPLIAVADCTGHGVPGAFMSLVGSSLLNQIVGQEPDLDPASILMQLDRLIRSTLKSVEGWGQPTDGMDIALCRWHEDSRTLIFAGAKRPLYWANPNRTQVLEEIKGDNRTIGGFGFASETHYNNIELRLEPGDMVYLTSDGFADQQNEQNKKLGSRTLRTLLGQICGWDVQSQREALINELERHQAGENQRDDITVLGLKFLN